VFRERSAPVARALASVATVLKQSLDERHELSRRPVDRCCTRECPLTNSKEWHRNKTGIYPM